MDVTIERGDDDRLREWERQLIASSQTYNYSAKWTVPQAVTMPIRGVTP